jgi:hypothetical protein
VLTRELSVGRVMQKLNLQPVARTRRICRLIRKKASLLLTDANVRPTFEIPAALSYWQDEPRFASGGIWAATGNHWFCPACPTAIPRGRRDRSGEVLTSSPGATILPDGDDSDRSRDARGPLELCWASYAKWRAKFYAK